MKILQVITSLQTGGAEKLITELVPGLKSKGHVVDVCLFDGRNTEFKKQLEECNSTIYSFSDGGNVYNPVNILKLYRIIKRYDVVHTHNTSPQLFGAICSVLSSRIFVTTEHTTSNRRRNWKWYSYVDKWMYRRYAGVICISDQAYNNLIGYIGNIDKVKISTIYNGVNVEKFHSALPNSVLKNNDKNIVVMVAGFRYQKDQDTLIRAFSLLPKEKFELWLVGDGERRHILENLVKKLDLSDVVRFLGERSDIPEVLHTADIIVMSSHFEGLSLSNIEGMSVGKPFIASDVDGLHEMTAGSGLLFEHGNERQLAEIMMNLMEDKEYYRAIAENCYTKAQKYDISRMVSLYDMFYRELLIKR